LGRDGDLFRYRQAGALIATVVGLLVAIPAMFAYNYMVIAH
jgi:hypothetical protein